MSAQMKLPVYGARKPVNSYPGDSRYYCVSFTKLPDGRMAIDDFSNYSFVESIEAARIRARGLVDKGYKFFTVR